MSQRASALTDSVQLLQNPSEDALRLDGLSELDIYLVESNRLRRTLHLKQAGLGVGLIFVLFVIFFFFPRLPEINVSSVALDHVAVDQNGPTNVSFNAFLNLTLHFESKNIFSFIIDDIDMAVEYQEVLLGAVRRKEPFTVAYGETLLPQRVRITSDGLAHITAERAELLGQMLARQLLLGRIQWTLTGSVKVTVLGVSARVHLNLPLTAEPFHFIPVPPTNTTKREEL